MGLTEKRALKAFQDEKFPQIINDINEAAGKTIELDVDWNSIMANDHDHLFEDAWNKVYFISIVEALKGIAIDDMGKEAIAEGLDKIVIKNLDNNYYPDDWSSLQDKILSLNHKPFSNIDHTERRTEALLKVLEDNL